MTKSTPHPQEQKSWTIEGLSRYPSPQWDLQGRAYHDYRSGGIAMQIHGGSGHHPGRLDCWLS